MATGVKPRDEDVCLTRADLDDIQEAMKKQKFRDLLSEFCEEIRDPANRALYQKEMVQLEKERGYDVTFLNPKGGYVIKTSVAGDRKAFINICSNENVDKPGYKVQEVDGKRGMNWHIPYSIIPPREDFDNKRERCVIYDVLFHPDTLRMAEVNKQFRELVNKSAFEGLQNTYNIHFDINNFRFPKSHYKGGLTVPAVIRKEDPNYKPPVDEENEVLTPEIIEKLYPQRNYSNSENNDEQNVENMKEKENADTIQQARKLKREKVEFTHKTYEGYTIPKYVIKQQKNVDLQEFTNHRDSKQHSAIPSHIVIEINLPLLSSTKDCALDVQEKCLVLTSEKQAKYRLEIPFPYSVNADCGSAKFDKCQRRLTVTLPVIKQNLSSENNSKLDSGVESEENTESYSDEDRPNLVVELSSTPSEPPTPSVEVSKPCFKADSFFDTSLGYILPTYTHNILDDTVAFTFHVKNTVPDSVQVKNDGNKTYIKFSSIGSGFVPVHYAAVLAFDDNIKFDNVSGEAWDNNVILQLELAEDVPEKFQIGLNSEGMVSEYFDVSQVKRAPKQIEKSVKQDTEVPVAPLVEVTNLGSETNIVFSSNSEEYDEDDDEDDESPVEKEIVWTESNNKSEAKSILWKPMSMTRSFSESSAGDVASSMDYISSDCIPEESSYKKTVRFNNVISKQFYRYNSSIEGQKKKNQRKKSKKRSSERQKSESEAEDSSNNNTQSKSRLKSVLKNRCDSGLHDTSETEGEGKNSQDDGSYTPKSSNENEMVCNGVSTKSILNIVNNKDEMSPEKSGNEAENDSYKNTQPKSRLKVVLKQRRDSGLADTSDAEGESKNSQDEGSYTPEFHDENENVTNGDSTKSILNIVDIKEEKSPELWESETEKIEKSAPITCETEEIEKSDPITCETIKHNTEFYNPDKLNKGRYLEVTFKNDLIFDLDM